MKSRVTLGGVVELGGWSVAAWEERFSRQRQKELSATRRSFLLLSLFSSCHSAFLAPYRFYGPSLPCNKLDDIWFRIELCVSIYTRVAYDSAALRCLATCSPLKLRDTDEVNIWASWSIVTEVAIDVMAAAVQYVVFNSPKSITTYQTRRILRWHRV